MAIHPGVVWKFIDRDRQRVDRVLVLAKIALAAGIPDEVVGRRLCGCVFGRDLEILGVSSEPFLSTIPALFPWHFSEHVWPDAKTAAVSNSKRRDQNFHTAILQQNKKFDTRVHFDQDYSMLNKMKYSLPAALQNDVRTELDSWKTEDKIARIWAKDASIWTGDDEAKWLDWLTIVDEELADTAKYDDLRQDIEQAGFTDVLLMGMGGSSLCPEVLALTFGKANFHILDSTVPAQVKTVEDKLDLEKTLFIVASKSGSTLEPNCFKQYFFERVSEKVGHENAGKQFIAITDPGSKMEQVAKDDGFRHIFYGKPQIGGRFSALSAFGMTAAVSMGLDPNEFLKTASEMVNECRNSGPETNAGALLGLILGVCHKHGRDKLTIFTTPEIHDLGAWLEQLVAESTGKLGVAIIPVDREAAQSSAYGTDRIFAFLAVGGNDALDEQYTAVTAAGHPAVKIELNSIDDLGQEFFRWEFATAVAGAVMQINPVQPARRRIGQDRGPQDHGRVRDDRLTAG